VHFDVAGGVPDRTVVNLDEDTLSNARLDLFQVQFPATRGYFGTCSYSLYACGIHQVEIEGGDVFRFEHCHHCPWEWECKANPAGIPRARFVTADQDQTIDDYFHLVGSMRHHNWGSDHLVVLDTPVGPVHALYLGTESYPDHDTFARIHYLDATFQTLEEKTINSHTTLSDW
jgi:hypothetical protein